MLLMTLMQSSKENVTKSRECNHIELSTVLASADEFSNSVQYTK